MANLYEFHEGESSEEIGKPVEWKEQLPVKPVEEVEEIMATRIRKNIHQKDYIEYLVKWKKQDLKMHHGIEQELAHLRENSI